MTQAAMQPTLCSRRAPARPLWPGAAPEPESDRHWPIPVHHLCRTTVPPRRSALRVLGSLAGLLQSVLLAFGGAGVPGQEPGLLQRRPIGLIQLDQRSGDGQAESAGLAG